MKPLFVIPALLLAAGIAAAADRPNMVYILADDMGFGDVSALNPAGKIKTPNLDRIAREGMVFTDAHSGSSVCTPTRYGILTGRYAWRTRLQRGPLSGTNPHLIAEGRTTVASFLKTQGYRTACIGKWHIGMDLPMEGKQIDWKGEIAHGPNAVGFDYFYGISASLDMPPYVYIENDRFTLPADRVTTEKGHRSGPIAEGFVFDQVLQHLTGKAVDYLCGNAGKGQPLFLYLCFPSPHTPIVPAEEFKGLSGLGDYGDFVVQTDAMVGRVLAALDDAGLGENTLVFYTSDNGCSPAANYKHLAEFGHDPSAGFRGAKADIYEGGHRVPFLVKWPGRIAPGSRSDELVCLTDLLATCTDLFGEKLPDEAGEDSVSILPALLGKSGAQPLREAVVHHSGNGSFAIRQGDWKLAMVPGSGGWSEPVPGSPEEAGLPPRQLFNLAEDLGEQHNRFAENPEKAEQLAALLRRYVDSGRSTPGKAGKNDVPVDIERKVTPKKLQEKERKKL